MNRKETAARNCSIAKDLMDITLERVTALGVTIKAGASPRGSKGVTMVNAVVLSPDKMIYYHPDKN